MINVFFDGKCSVCAKEIKYYQKVAPNGVFNWVDITKTPEEFLSMGYKVNDGLKLMHVQNNAGEMKIGVDAFLVMWRGLGSYWSVLAAVVGLPIIKQLVSMAYLIFAHFRFKKMGYKCEL